MNINALKETIESGIGNDNWANVCNDALDALNVLVERIVELEREVERADALCTEWCDNYDREKARVAELEVVIERVVAADNQSLGAYGQEGEWAIAEMMAALDALRVAYDARERQIDKGYSEEKCLRCGWVMGQPPLNCQNDNTPHQFPSQVAHEEQLLVEIDNLEQKLRIAREAL